MYRFGGRCPTASAWLPLETTLCVFRCQAGVCDGALLDCDIVWYVVQRSLVSPVIPLCFSAQRVGEVSEQPFRGPRHLVFLNVGYCVLGADPMVGRCLRLSVPWSLKTALATPRVFDSSGRIVVSGR